MVIAEPVPQSEHQTETQIMSEQDLSEAPAEESGAEETNNANLSIEELASSFVEKVESEAEESEPEAPEEEAEAGEDEESDVLSQSIEEDSEEEPEDESEEDDQPKGLKRALSQINRLTARAKGAEEEVAALKEQIRGLKSQPSEPTQDGAKPTLEQVQTIQELNDLRKEAMAAKKWALQHIGNEYVEVDGKEFSDEDIRQILMEAEEYLGEKIPERANFLQEKQNWQQETATTFPGHRRAKDPNGSCSCNSGKAPSTRPSLTVCQTVTSSQGSWSKELIRSRLARRNQRQSPRRLHLLLLTQVTQ